MLFTLSQPLPLWMEQQIEEDLASFVHSGIDRGNIAETLPNLTLFKIKGGKLVKPTLFQAIKHARVFKTAFFLRKILKLLPFPDMEFLFSTLDRQEQFLSVPIFAISKTPSDKFLCLFPHVEWPAYWDSLKKKIPPCPWEERLPLLFWRGATTGEGFDTGTNSRMRVTQLSLLHPEKVDASFSALVQGVRALPLKPPVPPERQTLYRYLLALDGNCFAGSLFWQLFSGSLVFKQDSPHLEWYYKGLKPFVHYVPFCADASDLLEKKEWADANGEKAREIAHNASLFSATYLSKEAIAYYVYKLLCRYASLCK